MGLNEERKLNFITGYWSQIGWATKATAWQCVEYYVRMKAPRAESVTLARWLKSGHHVYFRESQQYIRRIYHWLFHLNPT